MSEVSGRQIFKAKTKEAFVIKIIGELLANTLTHSQFTINNNGIFLFQANEPENQLVEISLYKEAFGSNFKCIKDINFLINSTTLYKLLKNIKKKDSISITITENEEDESMTLGICVEPPDNNNKLTTNIRIASYQPTIMEPISGYENPVVMSGKEFQGTKNLQHSSDTMFIQSKGEYIKFSVCDDDRHDRKLEVGNIDDEDNRDCSLYSKTFKTAHITSLCKCAGQSQSIHIYLNDDLPLKIKMKAGGLGDISVYIKSLEMIADEADEDFLNLNTKKDTEKEYYETQSNNNWDELQENSKLNNVTELEDEKSSMPAKPKRGRQKKILA